MPGRYRVAPIFLIRMAGVPFDLIEQLSTQGTTVLARQFLARQADLATAQLAAEQVLRSRNHGLSAEVVRFIHHALRSDLVAGDNIAIKNRDLAPDIIDAATKAAACHSQLQESLERDLNGARLALFRLIHKVLPAYLVFAAEGVRELRAELLRQHPAEYNLLPKRNSEARKRERHLLLYLQRICAKNDTFSRF